MKTKSLFLLVAACCSFSSLLPFASAQGTAFTYQGRLDAAGSPANGIYDLEFRLFDAASGGTQQSGTWTQLTQGVTNGLFTVELDFGSFFPGASRWLQIGVRTNGGSSFTILTPRQKFAATPYAITAGNFSGSITAAQLPAGVVTNSASGVNLTGNFSGNGANVTNVNAATLGGLSSAGFWKTNGNTGANPANGAFLGTTDNQALEIRVNNVRGLRIEPDPRPDNNSANLIGGNPSNLIEFPGSGGSAIVGGGFPDGGNVIRSNSSGVFIGAGSINEAGPNANDVVIAGGYGNIVRSALGVIGGGAFNQVQTNSDYVMIGGGSVNVVQSGSGFSTVAGGYANSIQTNSGFSAIGGGQQNEIQGLAGYSAIGGGVFNKIQVTADLSVIAGGNANQIFPGARESFIGGGFANQIRSNAYGSVIGGGSQNVITNAGVATIGGGVGNTNMGYAATVAGGFFNTAANNGAAVGGGGNNSAFGFNSVVAGGNNNLAAADDAVIGGGHQNTILNASPYATISGGVQNTIQTNAYSATISGGAQNTIQTNGYYSTIGGGVGNVIQNYATGSTIGGGYVNVIQANAIDATIGGGQENTIQVNAGYSTIAGGSANVIQYNAGYATIGGGSQNSIQSNAFAATIPGGWLNSAGANYAFAAGRRAKANHTAAFVWADSTGADFTSTADNQFLIRAGGGVGINKNNPATALDVAGTVTATSFSGSGGSLTSLNAANLTGTITDARLSANVALLNASQTFAGLNLFNNANNSFAGTFAGTGTGLTALNASQVTSGTLPDTRLSANIATLNGAQTFTGAKTFSAPSTFNNFVGIGTSSAIGSGSFIVSTNTSGFAGMYVNSGASGLPFYGYAQNGSIAAYSYVDGGDANKWKLNGPGGAGVTLTVTTAGNVGIGTTLPANKLHVLGGATFTSGSGGVNQTVSWTPGSASWSFTSDRNAKDRVTPVNPGSVLEKVARIPINEWSYIGYDQRHIGPMAQDFHAQFPLNTNDKALNDADLHGVALAAIQGLNEKLETKSQKLEAENADLRTRLEKLERLLGANHGGAK